MQILLTSETRFIESANRPDLLFTPATPRKFPTFTKDPFNFLDAQDLALYHPLDDFGTVERCVVVMCLYITLWLGLISL